MNMQIIYLAVCQAHSRGIINVGIPLLFLGILGERSTELRPLRMLQELIQGDLEFQVAQRNGRW